MPNRSWLHLLFEGPLLAFGGVRVDQFGPTRDFPAASMLVGLIGNALGWERADSEAHQCLQSRLVFGARREREFVGSLLVDFQNAKLGRYERGWTTSGAPVGRAGASYKSVHRRERHYHMDLALRIVLRLEPQEGDPSIEEIAKAIERPARPLYIGRKPCLPTGQIMQGWVTGKDAFSALVAAAPIEKPLRAVWPEGSGPGTQPFADQTIRLTDVRNWSTGIHAGSRNVVEGWVHPSRPHP
ncbi:MAG: type I-E CRISPR-associated protein Cas5/CasD [Erythrobacter sp.]|uniref:type I-E CRISPR-associated protein Cas5/CasD n=1 Tax=Erythrobacter sp. TaxID=1042 RepID=UPI003A86B004